MKNAITRNQNDPVLAGADVVPTDTMALPTAEPITPVQDLIVDALQRRPELAQSRIDLTNREIAKRAARNALLPSLDAVGFYGGSALAGSLNPGFAGAPPGTVNTGYGDAFSNLGAYPDYFVGLNLTIPIRNRGAQADQVRSELEFRQAQVRLQQLQNQIGIEVRNAQFSVLQNRARVDAAQKGRDFASQSLSAEQKKYALGASTTYNVLLALNVLASAESSLVAAMTAYEQSRVQLDQVTGRTLESLGIDVDDAENGTVTRPPNVPGVLPASQVTGQPISPTSTTPQATPQATTSKSTPQQPTTVPKQ